MLIFLATVVFLYLLFCCTFLAKKLGFRKKPSEKRRGWLSLFLILLFGLAFFTEWFARKKFLPEGMILENRYFLFFLINLSQYLEFVSIGCLAFLGEFILCKLLAVFFIPKKDRSNFVSSVYRSYEIHFKRKLAYQRMIFLIALIVLGVIKLSTAIFCLR